VGPGSDHCVFRTGGKYTPNAIPTLQAYLADCASPAVRELGERLIRRELEQMPEGAARQGLENRLHRIRTSDERDLYY